MSNPFVHLIKELRGIGSAHHEVLADNLQRDLPYEDVPAPAKRVDGFGKNIPEEMANRVASQLHICTAAGCTNVRFPDHFHSWICGLSGDVNMLAFELPENQQNRTAADVRCVRYVSLRAFLSQAQDLDKNDRSLQAENIRLTTERLMTKHRSPGAPASAKSVWLHLPGDFSRVVFVGPDAEAPDAQGSNAGLAGDALGRHVIQRLALPGFENAKRRADRGGFMALCFVPEFLKPPLPIYKPTIFDAADNIFFRPGPTDEPYGLTDTLNDALDAVLNQPGCKEWVTRNGAVPLAPSIKHGQTWRFVAYFDQ